MDIDTDDIPPQLLRELRDNLRDDEKILWVGRPQQGLIFEAEDIGWTLLFLLTTTPIFWGATRHFETTPPFDGSLQSIVQSLAILPLVLFVIYALVGRFFYDMLRRAKTIYAVTNQRTLIISGVLRRWQNSPGFWQIELIPRGKNRTTIKLGPKPSFFAWGPRGFQIESILHPQFERIENANAVLSTIEQARKG